MKLEIIRYNGTYKEVECDSFEFRSNQVRNWIKLKKGESEEIIHHVAVIRPKDD